ncbi:hypothetical protein [Sphingobacterium tabacisoli]|uniref:Lipoprotein n=1 Tax=Sphingobacterium tabacisoli TaxID=2044855 RepID=A0ABW5L2F7_9SPHI|nr:hypothetical protein [Sphingobacterium tabacisoli]
MIRLLLYSLSTIFFFLSGCSTPLEKGETLPFSDATSVWENLYLKNELNGKRIALKGFISLQELRIRGNEQHCQLVDKEGNHLSYLIIKKSNKNSLKLTIKDTEKVNNLQYIDIDYPNSYILDNEGKKLPLNQNVLVSFDIKYSKNAETDSFVVSEATEDGAHPFFKDFSKKGQRYYFFYADNIRIDSI